MSAPHPIATRTAAGGRVVGESLVWLTAMGLSIGLVMVAGLLLLILCNGISVFWPRTLVEYAVTDHGVTTRWLGTEVKHQVKSTGTGSETQIYTGNKDAYPPFRFVDDAAIAEHHVPLDAMLIERLQYGNAIGYPVELRTSWSACRS